MNCGLKGGLADVQSVMDLPWSTGAAGSNRQSDGKGLGDARTDTLTP